MAKRKRLEAVADQFRIALDLRPLKPPVIHGVNGVSQKAEGAGRASHYVSFTRIETRGTIAIEGREFTVEGLSWMDHEFFTHQLEAEQTGWDWLSVQFDDGTELMLFRLRRKDGSMDPYSAGTFVDADGRSAPSDESRLSHDGRQRASGRLIPSNGPFEYLRSIWKPRSLHGCRNRS
jgi:predicted secreted hydrolase